MKKVLIFLVMLFTFNVMAEEISKEKNETVPSEINTKTVDGEWLPCSANEKKCVVRGYKYNVGTIAEGEKAVVKRIVEILNEDAKGGVIDLVGYTDNTGSRSGNLKLSVKRAEEVAELMRAYGLDRKFSFGEITGKGEENPSDTNSTAAGRYNNRRVEIYFSDVEFK